MKHKIFLNGVNLYDGESESECLACWALAIRVVGVTSANAHILRYAAAAVAREEYYRFGRLISDDMIGVNVADGIKSKERIN